jgi:uncharacterized protein YjdB
MAFCALLGLSANAQTDVTDTYLQNADLSTVGSGWNYGDDGYNYEAWNTSGSVPVVEFYYQWNPTPGGAIGSTRKFHFTQEVTLPAGSYRLAVNGFYREGSGNGSSKAFIFISDANADPADPVYLAQKDMHGLTSAEQANVSNSNGSNTYTGGSDLLRAANAFSKGDFSNEFDFDLEHEQRVIIGFRGYIDTYCSWCILGPVKLFQYNLSDYLVAYDQKVTEAEALYDSPMNKDVLAALKAAVVNKNTLTTTKLVTEAISKLDQKITAARQSISNYADVKSVLEAANNLTASGKAAYAASSIISELQSGYDARTLTELTAEQKAAAQEALAAAVKEQTEVGADYTLAAPADWVGQTGTFWRGPRAERYNPQNGQDASSTVYDGDVMTQTLTGMPQGAYEVVLEAAGSFTSGRGFTLKSGDDLAVVFANTDETNLPIADRTDNESDYGPYTVIGKVGSDGVLKYGIKKLDQEGGNWFVVKLMSIKKVEYVPVTSITAADVEVEELKTVSIGATVNPSNATLPKITYTSGDESIATVDKDGVVTGVAIGNTTITLTADEVTKVINVTVKAPAVLPESIALDPESIELKLDKTTSATITATVSPAEANQEVTFASSDESVVTVDQEGNVTATGIGSATITVTSSIKADVSATVPVTVSAASAPDVYTNYELLDNTDYWFYNAATGLYLGGGNDWGTRASLIEHGIPFNVVKTGENLYTLDSHTDNGDGSHYLSGVGYIDQPVANLTIIKNANGTYSIGVTTTTEDATNGQTSSSTAFLKAKLADPRLDFVGTDANDPFAQWYAISIDDHVNMLGRGTSTDATCFIKDFNFSRNNTMYSEWEWTFADPENLNHNNDGENDNLCVESYHAAFNQTQVVSLPNGTYKLTAQGFYRNDGGTNPPVFFANDEELAFSEKTGSENSMAAASRSFSSGLYKSKPIEVTVTDHTLKIGAKCEDTNFWCIWDNFELELVSFSEDQAVKATIGQAGYSTLYYGKLNLTIDNSVTNVIPYAVSLDGNVANLTELPSYENADDIWYDIPAGTGVVLKGDPGDYPLYVPTYQQYPDEFAVKNNILEGTDEETTFAEEGYKYFVLSTDKEGNVGFFYPTKGGNSLTNAPHKAYFKLANSSASAFYINFNGQNGISNTTVSNMDNNEIYTISGVRVNGQLQKGVYIVNGKKVVIK